MLFVIFYVQQLHYQGTFAFANHSIKKTKLRVPMSPRPLYHGRIVAGATRCVHRGAADMTATDRPPDLDTASSFTGATIWHTPVFKLSACVKHRLYEPGA